MGEVKSEHSSVSRSYVRKSTAFVSGCRGSGKQMCNRRGRTMAVPFFSAIVKWKKEERQYRCRGFWKEWMSTCSVCMTDC